MRNIIIYAQELVYGLALVAFGFTPSAPLVATLLSEYPLMGNLFRLFLVLGGVGMMVSVFRPHFMFTSWLFSAFVTGAAFIGSFGIESDADDVLYPITWGLFCFLAVTQAYRHFGGDENGT